MSDQEEIVQRKPMALSKGGPKPISFEKTDVVIKEVLNNSTLEIDKRNAVAEGLKNLQKPGQGTIKNITEEVVVNDGTLAFAASLLLKALPDYAQEAIRDMADNQVGIPLWHYMSGILLRAYNNGELAVYDLDPAWGEPGFGSSEPKCAVCKKNFSPNRMGQKVCGQECGAIFAEQNRKSNVTPVRQSPKAPALNRIPQGEAA